MIINGILKRIKKGDKMTVILALGVAWLAYNHFAN